ncbi:MAG: hypothetical protein PUB46_02225 [Lachnospiraceae bacterium]|nr:hypothetical protein [Lachnospiraceae bacterium]
MTEKTRKAFRLSEDVLKKIEERNKGLYPTATQYVEAAVLAFPDGEKMDWARVEQLEKKVLRLEQEVFEKSLEPEMEEPEIRLPKLTDN